MPLFIQRLVVTCVNNGNLDRAEIDLHIDHPYILAFSIIMLHTDAFNRSNKRKMTRADYVKNASLDGVSALILEVSVSKSQRYFYTDFVLVLLRQHRVCAVHLHRGSRGR